MLSIYSIISLFIYKSNYKPYYNWGTYILYQL